MAFGCMRLKTSAVAVAACALALAGCAATSSMPSLGLPNLDLFDQPSTGTVTVHSNPTGAEAHASNGNTCRTPCALSMPSNEGFSITYTLDGYLPETVAVKSIPPQKGAIIDMTPGSVRAEPGLGRAQARTGGASSAPSEKAAAVLRLSASSFKGLQPRFLRSRRVRSVAQRDCPGGADRCGHPSGLRRIEASVAG